MILADLNTTQLSALDKASTVIVVPLSSVEQHGPHLPLTTKSFVAEAVAFEAAQRLKTDNLIALITPSVPFMPCHTSYGFPGCFSMGSRTYSDALYEIGNSFYREGFRFLYFINFSISPDALKAVSVAVEDLNTLRDFKAFDPMPLWSFTPNETIDALISDLGLEPANELHADIKETSAMLSLLPELVDEQLLASLQPCKINTTWEVLKGNFSFEEMGSTAGYLGTPALADKNLGVHFLEEAAFAFAEAIKYTIAGNELPELPLQIRMLLKMVDLDEM